MLEPSSDAPGPAVPPPPPVAGNWERPKRVQRPGELAAESQPELSPLPPVPSAASQTGFVATKAAAGGWGQIRWLAFLFAEATVLLAFQLAAGLTTGSLALLADCGHSGADVVCYFVNYFVERRKAASAALACTAEQKVIADEVAKAAFHADFVGCIVSTVLLCAATGVAAVEAAGRLRLGGSGNGDSQGIGPALLAFAVVSTAANLGTLLIYRRCAARPPPLAAANERPRGTAAPACDRRPLAARLGRGELNVCGAYAGVPPGQAGWNSCCSGSHQCEGARAASWSAALHMLVHPGCSEGHACSSPGSAEDADEGPAKNLNVTAALLHLLADAFRGMTILVVAVLIEAELVVDAEKADAVCALIVAAFVALGSVALIQRAFTLLKWEHVLSKDPELQGKA